MAFTRSTLSLKHLLLLLYVVLVLLVLAMLMRDWHKNVPLFSLKGGSVKTDSAVPALSVYGEHFSPGIKGLMAKSLVTEKVLLSHSLTDVPLRLLDVSDGLILASYRRNKVVSVATQDGQKEQLLGSIEMPGTVGYIEIVGQTAVVGMSRGAGIALVDISDPVEMTLLSHHPLPGSVLSMVVDRNFVYYAGIGMGVGFLDLSAKKTSPEKLVSVESPWRLTFLGDKFAVGTLTGLVLLFDVGEDGRLIEVYKLNFDVPIRGVTFNGGELIVVFADNTLETFPLESWPVLQRSGTLALPGQPLNIKNVPGQKKVVVNLVAGGVAVVDVSVPTEPQISGVLKRPKSFRDFKVFSEELYATSHYGLEVFSLSLIEKGEASLLAMEAMIDQDYYTLHSWNNTLYGYNKDDAYFLSDNASIDPSVSGPYLPLVDKQGVVLYKQLENEELYKIGSLPVAEGAMDAMFVDDFLYVLYSEGLRVFDVPSSFEYTVVNDLKLSGRVNSFEPLSSQYLLVGTLDEGGWVVDIDDVKNPKRGAHLMLPKHLRSTGPTQDVVVNGQRAYFSQGTGGVHVFDVSSPDRPELQQIVATPGFAGVMALYDDILLVADSEAGLFLVEAKDNQPLLPLGRLPVPVRIHQMAVAGDGLIVSSRKGGTMKLPLPKRLLNVQVVDDGELKISFEGDEKGQHLYLYDDKTSGQITLDAG